MKLTTLIGAALLAGSAAPAALAIPLAADGSWHAFDVDPLVAASAGYEWIDLDDTGTPIDATVGAVMLTAVPEPATAALLLAGFAALGAAARRRG